MAGNTDDAYAALNNEHKNGASWGAAPIMHSWCLHPDQPVNTTEGLDGLRSTDRYDSKSRKSVLVNDADDDSGLELSLGLSLGGSSSCKPKGKEREKETLLDRDIFQEKDNFRDRRDSSPAKEVPVKEPFLDGVVIQSLKTQQEGGSRVQPIWQEFGRSGPDGSDEVSASQPSQRKSSPQQVAFPEANWRLAENSVAEDSKSFAHHMWQALQGKAAQPEHQRQPLSAQDEASLIKELQGLPPQAVATAAAWARFVAQGGVPLQLLEALKDGIDPSTRGVLLQPSLSISSYPGQQCEPLPAPVPVVRQQSVASQSTGLERSDSDMSKNIQTFDQQQRQTSIVQQQELTEQQRKTELQTQKRQEARRKRKALLEGQKQSKKAKKEDDVPGSSGPGSINGFLASDRLPHQLRRLGSLQPPPAHHAKEVSISAASSPPDSQDGGGASSIAAFRRPGSSSWSHKWEGSSQGAGQRVAPSKGKAEKSHVTVGGDSRTSQGDELFEIRRALQRATKDRPVKDDEIGAAVDSGGESRKDDVADAVHSQTTEVDAGVGGQQAPSRQEQSGSAPLGVSNMGPIPSQVDPAWIQRIIEMQMNSVQLTSAMESYRENAVKNLSSASRKQRKSDVAEDRHLPRLEAKKFAERARARSQTSSGGSENSEGNDGKSNNSRRTDNKDGETISSPPVSMGSGEVGSRPTGNHFTPPLSGAVPVGNMAYPSSASFPLLPGPYPFPMPVPPGATGGGVSYNVPFPFPYLMQFAPAPSNGDGNQDHRAHVNTLNPFQIALPPGYPPFQIQAPEGSTWASAVVRPHATPPQSPPRNGSLKRSQSGMPREDGNHSSRGGKSTKSRNTSPSRDLPLSTALSRASSMGSGAFNRLRPVANTNTPLSASSTSHFGISRSKSEAAALRREGSLGSAFATLADSSQAGAIPQANLGNLSKGSSSIGVGSVSCSENTASRVAAVSAEDAVLSGSARSGISGNSDAGASHSTSSVDEDMKRIHPAGVWRQGSLPNFEGLAGQEASSLRPGIALGQHFGGSGSPPDLPWVTCSSISGVLYRVEKGQVRIVCACHGRHMTPAEFVQHAGCGEMSNPEKAIVVGPFTIVTQQPASAQA